MSSSKQPADTTFLFRIRVPSEDYRVSIYDGRNEIIAEGEGPLEKQVPRGLYTVRVEHAGATWEKVYRHDGTTDESIFEPQRVSATPVFDTATTHEYYAYTSQEWSGRDTRPPLGSRGPASGRLFVFLRTLDAFHYQGENLAEGLLLLDSSGGVLSSFTKSEIQASQDGWLALSALAEPGSYLLRYEGEERREMPLYVYGGSSTQLFMSYQKGLRFETAVILMPRVDESFNPDDKIAQAVDAALAGLQQGRDFMPRGAMRKLLEGKFENPMLGLLGVHVLLLGRDLQSHGDLDFLVDRLDQLLPNSPDVQALRLMVAKRFGRELPLQPFERPPMLRAGLEAVLRASGQNPDLVPEGSLIERAAVCLHVDSPWTSWEPLMKLVEAPATSSIQQSFAPTLSSLASTWETRPTDSEWVAAYLRDAMQPRPWFRALDLGHLASQVAVPARVLERTLRELGLETVTYGDLPQRKALDKAERLQSRVEATPSVKVKQGLVLTCIKCFSKNFLDPYPFWNFSGNTKCASCDTLYAVKFSKGQLLSGPTATTGKVDLLPGYAEDKNGAGITGEGKIRPAPQSRPDPFTGQPKQVTKSLRGKPLSGSRLKKEDLVGSRAKFIADLHRV